MAEYKQVDLQIGTEAQFESKKETLPIGTFVGITDPIHKSELDSNLQASINSIANKLDKNIIIPTTNINLMGFTLNDVMPSKANDSIFFNGYFDSPANLSFLLYKTTSLL